MVDLLASLATGIKENIEISMSSTNRLIVETVNDFSEYIFDFNGFILTGKASKSFPTKPTGSFVSGNRILSGDQDGSIRAYSFTDGQ